jgi:WD40 repeat protein
MDLLFGYDFFISYSHDDGRNYPRRLYEKLTEIGYKVFLDTEDYHTGDDLNTGTKRRVRMSTKLVVIARPIALKSIWVLREVQEFLDLGRGPVVIDINESMKNAPAASKIKDLLQNHLYFKENFSTLDEDPSTECLNRLQNGFQAVRQETRRLRVFGITALFFAVISVLATWLFFEAKIKSQIAQSRQLAANADSLTDNAHDLKLLMSIEATNAYKTDQAKTVLFKNLQSHPQVKKYFQAYPENISSAVYSPNGEMLAAAIADSTITGIGKNGVLLWNVASGKLVAEFFNGHLHGVETVAFSPDGTMLASGSVDQTILLWDLASHQPQSPPLKAESTVSTVAFHPAGKVLASGSYDGKIIFWDIQNRMKIGEIVKAHDGVVNKITFSKDGKILASGGGTVISSQGDGNTIRLWDASTYEPIGKQLTGHRGHVQSLDFSPNTDLLASSGLGGNVILWDLTVAPFKDKLLQQGNPDGEPRVFSVAFDKDGKTIAWGDSTGKIKLWNVEEQTLQGDLPLIHNEAIHSLSFSPTDNSLISATNTKIILWDVVGPPQLWHSFRGNKEGVWGIDLSPDGTVLAVGGQDNTLALWSLEDKHPLAPSFSPNTGTAIRTIAFHPAGNVLCFSDGSKNVFLGDVKTRQLVNDPLEGNVGNVRDIDFSPDGKLLASSGSNGHISIWNTVTWKPIDPPLKKHVGDVWSVAFSPDGKKLASAGEDAQIILWDLDTHKPLVPPLMVPARESAFAPPILAVAFSPDGKLLATGSNDNQGKNIILWELENYQPIGPALDSHKSGIRSLSFSPDGMTLVSGDDDGNIVFWDVTNRKAIGKPASAHEDSVWDLVFSLDGKTVVSGSWDGTISILDIDLNSWQRQACATANRNFQCDEWREAFFDQPYRQTCLDLPPACGKR